MSFMNIYVGNLSYSVTEESLRTLFGTYGKVASVKVMTDRFTGNPRGFAFVTMDSADEATAAIAALNGQDFEGRRLRINEANPPAPRAEGGSRDGGPRRPGSFGGNGGGKPSFRSNDRSGGMRYRE